jgi:hypothetical protein
VEKKTGGKKKRLRGQFYEADTTIKSVVDEEKE